MHIPDPELSVVLPCYNESRGLRAICERFAVAGRGEEFELILVDNGSRDATPQTLREILPQFPFARSVRVEQNQGYGHGIWTGLQAARGRTLAWSHADLQTDPADVFRALAAYRETRSESPVLVKGTRSGRRLSERCISLGMQAVATLLFRMRLREINAQPKLFDRSLLAHLTRPPVDFNFDVYVLVQARRQGWKIEEIPVRFPPRAYGVSNWAATWKSKFRTIGRSLRYMTGLALASPVRTSLAGQREDETAGEANVRRAA